MSSHPAERRYLEGDYLAQNPDWDSGDSVWKADLVSAAIARSGIEAREIVEVGCGAGGVLAALRPAFPQARLAGYDIAPGAQTFWAAYESAGIEFHVGDFLEQATPTVDVVLLLDVVEHLPDPIEFLSRIRPRARHFVFHFPLDLSVLSVLREHPLLHVRRKVGHLSYYTRGLALALLEECGFRVLDVRFTAAGLNAPGRGAAARLASLPRAMLRAFSPDLAARLFGGETLIVVAASDAAVTID